uniref:Uncharacterized protein n=1 Tax=Kalanchoe fedtschenkoi TaxID=63787 RepID=A0A7N0VLE5_KALFE
MDSQKCHCFGASFTQCIYKYRFHNQPTSQPQQNRPSQNLSTKSATMSPCQTPTFTVSRHAPELIPPAKPTPNGLKDLSDCDDMPSLRVQVPFIQIFRQCDQGKDPAKVIKDAIAKALVHYYPLAGRLREVGSDKKLLVDCTGEGVVFVEADADVSVDEFGDVLHPPFPGAGELLCDPPGSLIGSPLLHFQVFQK